MIKNFSILLDNFVVKHLYIYIEKKKILKVIIQVNKMIHYWSFMKCWKPNNKNEKKKKITIEILKLVTWSIILSIRRSFIHIFIHIQLEEILK